MAVERAQTIGADCMQIFLSPPQQWSPPSHEVAALASFKHKRLALGIEPLFVHTIYLVNLCSPVSMTHEKSVQSVLSYLEWAEVLGADGVVTHLGSHGGSGAAWGERRASLALERMLQGSVSEVPLLLETSAGMGDSLGSRFEQIGRLIKNSGNHPRLQVCLDTAHIFQSGYDWTTEDGLQRALDAFDSHIGLARLALVHANDSKTPLGSAIDRHAEIGAGYIGEEAFSHLLNHPAVQHLPFIIEVPGFAHLDIDRENLAILRRLAGVAGTSKENVLKYYP